MINQENVTKFEFLLTLEGNIIVQRFFNVKDHVKQSRRSMDLHYCVKNICDESYFSSVPKQANIPNIEPIALPIY